MKATRTFDYVVVGAGTAGCVVACRLAASGASVALLEAGGPYRRLLDVPLLSLWAWLRRPARYCWQDWTEPQAALDGRRIFWPAGRLVGGSSAINAMIYCRGHPASYDRWQRLTGGQSDAPAWNYEALLPYFRRSEDFEGDGSVHHGTGGPIGVSASRHPTPLSEAFLRGCDELGIRRTDDFNSETAEGASYLHVTQRHGRRTSSERYLHPGPGLGPPTAWLGTPVTRIVFERGRATGVEVAASGGHSVIHAAREVILCAGVVRSPQLLMLSGVGPADVLRSLGIDVVADRPGVGDNLQDHLLVPVAFECAGPRPTSPPALLRGAIQYALTGRGVFASNVSDTAAIVRLDAGPRDSGPAYPLPLAGASEASGLGGRFRSRRHRPGEPRPFDARFGRPDAAATDRPWVPHGAGRRRSAAARHGAGARDRRDGLMPRGRHRG